MKNSILFEYGAEVESEKMNLKNQVQLFSFSPYKYRILEKKLHSQILSSFMRNPLFLFI